MFYKLILYLSLFGELANIIDAIPLHGEGIQNIDVREFPFVASLQKKLVLASTKEKHFCTGSLISKKDVLTAADCILGKKAHKIQVIVVDNDRRNPLYDVQWMLTYDLWANNNNLSRKFAVNDVAILRLTTEVLQSYSKAVIIAGSQTAHLYRTKAVMVGWNLLKKAIHLSNRLRKVEVEIHTPEVCERKMYLVSNIPYRMERNLICTAAKPVALPDCGDNGAPLLNMQKELIGITHEDCIAKEHRWGNFPMDFTAKYEVNIHSSVEYYRNFINSVTAFL